MSKGKFEQSAYKRPRVNDAPPSSPPEKKNTLKGCRKNGCGCLGGLIILLFISVELFPGMWEDILDEEFLSEEVAVEEDSWGDSYADAGQGREDAYADADAEWDKKVEAAYENAQPIEQTYKPMPQMPGRKSNVPGRKGRYRRTQITNKR